eukprot:NODE_4604_length_787_cov_6.659892_g4261_i0.p1 GENE.NODE_4604_length_787_cov_6.659892_g4261_i0~~NODE_4604_length_787_cov_6.659892_g4261_i0.p1  ORF type:complete len:146 (+),score=20.38 NODE_4604_length_787_cov_6.659892_g4261_i0:78-515(+)
MHPLSLLPVALTITLSVFVDSHSGAGYSMYFGSHNTAALLTHYDGLANATELTFEFWALPTTTNVAGYVLHTFAHEEADFFSVSVSSTIGSVIGDYTQLKLVEGYDFGREWHHYALALSSVSTFYIDGEVCHACVGRTWRCSKSF